MDGDSGRNRTRPFQVSFLSEASTSNQFPSDSGVVEGTMRVHWRMGGGEEGRASEALRLGVPSLSLGCSP